MKITMVILGILFSQFALGEGHFYRVQPGEMPIQFSELSQEDKKQAQLLEVIESLGVRIIIKRFTITKKDGNSKIRWEPVCEENSSIEVEDLSGGGLIQERVMLTCESEVKGHSVTVAVSGMVYESTWAGFSDESPKRMRNFMSHLSVHSNGRPIIFGPGDFNLGYTRELPFTHWTSELSTDFAGGGRAGTSDQDLLVGTTRQGFVTSIRYGKETGGGQL